MIFNFVNFNFLLSNNLLINLRLYYILEIFKNMRNFLIAALLFFLLYTNATFRSYTLEGLQSITNFIKELPKENNEKDPDTILKSGSSTY